ncbi:hypothetical protein SAMN05428939_1616 [Streptomyces sp. TLI_105]|nr:hypothetical protein SAMN05428939_1616 [Streptomyces sp. TLI_105]
MATLSLPRFLTLDGVIQAPGGPEEDPGDGFQHGGWSVPFGDEDFGRRITELFARPTAFRLTDARTTAAGVALHTYELAGRPTYGSH